MQFCINCVLRLLIIYPHHSGLILNFSALSLLAGFVPSSQKGARCLLEDLQLNLHWLTGRPHCSLPTGLQRREKHVRPLRAGICLVNTNLCSLGFFIFSSCSYHSLLSYLSSSRTESVFNLATVCRSFPGQNDPIEVHSQASAGRHFIELN